MLLLSPRDKTWLQNIAESFLTNCQKQCLPKALKKFIFVDSKYYMKEKADVQNACKFFMVKKELETI